jgi:RNA polymerase sigma-70 factor (ECF subfamily)
MAPGSTLSHKLAKQEQARAVRQAIGRLPDGVREVLLMRAFEGATYEEAALVLGISPEAARKRYGRAILRLHKLLVKSGFTESRP